MKTYQLLVLLSVAQLVLSSFFSLGILQVGALGESIDAEQGLHTIPTDGGVYDTLTQVEIVTPVNMDPKNWTYAYEARWFMDETPTDPGGLSLHAVESTPTNITWRATLQNIPSPGYHSFTFRVLWSNNTLLDGLLNWTRSLWTKDYLGSFTFTRAYMHYGFDELLNWTVVGGNWSVLNGSLDGFSSAEGLIHTGDIIKNDYVLNAKVKIAADSPRAEASFCVCFADSGNYYWAGLGCWGNRVSISRMIDHIPEKLIISGDGAEIVKDVWYNLSIEVSCNSIWLYVNDVLELVVNNSTFSSGVIGVRTSDSHVLVDYLDVSVFEFIPSNEPTPPFTADGKYIVDKYGRKTMMKGFQLDAGKMVGYRSSGFYSRQEVQRIKDWGFHFVYSDIWWGNIEDKETGEYDLAYLYRYGTYINMCAEVGLHWIFRFRVSYDDSDPPYWAGWGRHRYVCTDEGLQRYCNFLEWAIKKLEQRFPNVIVAYHMWQYPFHRTGLTSTQKTFYYSKAVPAMVGAARKHTDKLLIVSSVHTKPEEFMNMKKVNDSNVAYAFSYYGPQKHSGSYEPVWEGTQSETQYQWNLIEPAVNFMDTYNVPLNVVEFGIRLERDDQIALIKLKLQILDHYGIGWCYWWYSWYERADNLFNLFYGDEGTPKQKIINALLDYNQKCYITIFGANWETINGNWTVENGKLRGNCASRGVILYAGNVGKNYEITCKVCIISSSPALDESTEYYRPEGQIALRYEGSGDYYFAGIGAYGYKAGIGTFVDGKDSMLTSRGNLTYADVRTGVWYDLKIVAVESSIILLVDGQLVCQTIDLTHTIGQVGLTAIWSTVYYDDFAIKKI